MYGIVFCIHTPVWDVSVLGLSPWFMDLGFLNLYSSWTRLCRYGIPMSRERFIFNTGIHLLVKRHLYIETTPWFCSYSPPCGVFIFGHPFIISDWTCTIELLCIKLKFSSRIYATGVFQALKLIILVVFFFCFSPFMLLHIHKYLLIC